MSTPAGSVSNSSQSDDARYQRALAEIFGRLNYERTPDAARSLQDFRLQHMRELLEALGNPQLQVPTVHVAGSKGKGSTATMVACMAEAAGYRVGLFTSPHVDSFEERFTINGVPPTHPQVADLYDRILALSDGAVTARLREESTFFELATALGWLHFARERVDLAVIEVGLGGRLDSTNVCQPLVSVITSISRDHTRLLGNTLGAIAREKAGIIKPGIPVVSGVTTPEPADVIAEVAVTQGAPLFRLDREFQHRSHVQPDDAGQLTPPRYLLDFDGFDVKWNGLQPCMVGEHQTRNAAVAVSVARLLEQQGFPIPETAVRRGLAQARCPLRVEVVAQAPLTIVDAAHNPASIAALCESLRPVPLQRRLAIFASSRDKEVDMLLQLLDGSMDEIWLTRYSNNPRGIELAELEQLARRVLTRPWRMFDTPAAALAAARQQSSANDLICVTGSFFLAAEAKAILSAR